LVNSILWCNSATNGDELALQGSSSVRLDVAHCDVDGDPNDPNVAYVQPSCTLDWGDGNIDQDPCFVDPNGPDGDPNTWDDNDYHLSGGSPCINAGDPNGDYTGQTDIDGQKRVMNGRVDMGSDEKPPCGSGLVPMLPLMLGVLGLLVVVRRKG